MWEKRIFWRFILSGGRKRKRIMYSPHSRQHSVNSQGSLPRPGQLTRQDSRWTTITESGKSAKIVSHTLKKIMRRDKLQNISWPFNFKQDESLKNMRRNAPPVSPLSPERVDHTQINSSSPNLTLEQSRTQIDPFYRHVSISHSIWLMLHESFLTVVMILPSRAKRQLLNLTKLWRFLASQGMLSCPSCKNFPVLVLY